MKRKILIITNTYFQLIVAVQLKLTEFVADDVDIIITDCSIKSEEVANKVLETKLFRNVYCVKIQKVYTKQPVIKKYKRYLTSRINPKKTLKNYITLSDDYTDFLFNNANYLTYLIWLCYRKQVKLYRFEEGFSTYTKPLREDTKLHNIVMNIVLGNLEKSISGLYLFHPEYFKRKVSYPLLPIKILDKEDLILKDYLNTIFEYSTPEKLLSKKYIFLEESFRISNIVIDDIGLVEKIIAKVGKENIIVKQHPRNRVNVWEEKGIDSFQTKIPWELILMNENFSDKVLITITSGSALASKLYLFDDIKAVFLFKYIRDKLPMLDNNFLQYLNDVLEDND